MLQSGRVRRRSFPPRGSSGRSMGPPRPERQGGALFSGCCSSFLSLFAFLFFPPVCICPTPRTRERKGRPPEAGHEPARRGGRDAGRPPAGPAQRTGRGGRNRGASQRDLLRPTPAWNESEENKTTEQRVAGAGAARGAKDRPRKERNKAERSEAWREPAQPAREGRQRDADDPRPYEHKPEEEDHSRRRGGAGGRLRAPRIAARSERKDLKEVPQERQEEEGPESHGAWRWPHSELRSAPSALPGKGPVRPASSSIKPSWSGRSNRLTARLSVRCDNRANDPRPARRLGGLTPRPFGEPGFRIILEAGQFRSHPR